MINTKIIFATVLTSALLVCVIVLSLYWYFHRNQLDKTSSDVETTRASDSSSTLSKYPLQQTHSFQGSEVSLVQQKYVDLQRKHNAERMQNQEEYLHIQGQRERMQKQQERNTLQGLIIASGKSIGLVKF